MKGILKRKTFCRERLMTQSQTPDPFPDYELSIFDEDSDRGDAWEGDDLPNAEAIEVLDKRVSDILHEIDEILIAIQKKMQLELMQAVIDTKNGRKREPCKTLDSIFNSFFNRIVERVEGLDHKQSLLLIEQLTQWQKDA